MENYYYYVNNYGGVVNTSESVAQANGLRKIEDQTVPPYPEDGRDYVLQSNGITMWWYAQPVPPPTTEERVDMLEVAAEAQNSRTKMNEEILLEFSSLLFPDAMLSPQTKTVKRTTDAAPVMSPEMRYVISDLWATYIINGERTFAQVPNALKQEVADRLLAQGRGDLVPVEFGGTMQ